MMSISVCQCKMLNAVLRSSTACCHTFHWTRAVAHYVASKINVFGFDIRATYKVNVKCMWQIVQMFAGTIEISFNFISVSPSDLSGRAVR